MAAHKSCIFSNYNYLKIAIWISFFWSFENSAIPTLQTYQIITFYLIIVLSYYKCYIYMQQNRAKQTIVDYHRVLSFISYRLVNVLLLKSFENYFLELDFSIFKKNVFLRSNLLKKVIFLHGYEIFFSRFLLLSIYENTSESIRPCFRKTSDMSQQP